MSTEGNITKLPKWAQHEIEHLQRQVADRDALIGRLRTVVTREAEEGIIIDPYGSHPIYFDPANTVRLWLKPGKFAIDVSMRANMYGPRMPHLNVSGYGLRSTGMIAIVPVAGNVIAVAEGER